MNKARVTITFGAFISIACLGMTRTFLGTALPAIRSSLDLTLIQAGTLTALLQLSFAVAVFFGGPISDALKKSLIIILGLLVMGTNLFFFGFSRWFLLSLSITSFIGIGGGLIEAASNPLLVQLYPGRESILMNLHHFFFAIGLMAGPLIMGTVLSKSWPWQWAYIGLGLFVFAIVLFLLSQRISSPALGKKLNMRIAGELIRQRSFLCLFFLMFLGNGVQSGIIYWLVTFLKETRGFSITLASVSLSLFLLCVAVGRLVASYLLTRINDVLYVMILFSLVFFFVGAAVHLPGKWAIPLFAICGFGISALFPTLLGIGGRIYSEMPGTAMGLIVTGASLGGMFIPWLMSVVSQMTNLTLGFLSFEIYPIAALVILGVNFRRLVLAGNRTREDELKPVRNGRPIKAE